MAGPRQPIDLILNKGAKHLTKAEIANRRASEIVPCKDDITPPTFLNESQTAKFNDLAAKLAKLDIMGETDCDTLGRYVFAQDMYEKVSKEIGTIDLGDSDDCKRLPDLLITQGKFFDQAHKSASALGLTITSRCKIALPPQKEEKKENRFSVFLADQSPEIPEIPRSIEN